MIDSRDKLATDAGKGGRANGKEMVKPMARRRYQTGCLFIRGKRREVWVARWREDVIRPDGSLGRVHQSEVLGPLSEISNRREARTILDSLLRPFNQGRHRPQATLLFEQFVHEQWEPLVPPTLKPSTAQYYQLQLRRHLLPALGQLRICDMTQARVQSFLVSKRQQGYSGSTVHGTRTTLSKVLQSAVEWGYLEQNPAQGIRIGNRQPTRERKFLLQSQVLQLLNSLSEPCRTLVLLAVLGGFRIGELLALRWKHIDFLRGVIQVREMVYEGRFGSPKTRSSRRDVPMSDPMREALLAHRTGSNRTEPDDLIFASRCNTPLNPKNLLRRVLQPACRESGLPVVSWHSFRHTHATLLSEVGESLKTAQALLGHSDLETTLNVYTHAIPESQRRAVNKVAEILFSNVPKFQAQPESQRAN